MKLTVVVAGDHHSVLTEGKVPAHQVVLISQVLLDLHRPTNFFFLIFVI